MDNPDDIRAHIEKFEDNIHKVELNDEYRKPLIKRTKMDFEDFIDFTTHSKITNKIYKLKTYMQLPDKEVEYKGIMYVFHGLQVHTNTHANIAKEHAKLGIVSVGFDYRGHGLSEGTNGDVECFEELISDAEYFILAVENYFKSKFKDDNKENFEKNTQFLNNRFCQGLSMGGLLSFFIANRNKDKFKGVFFMAPAFATPFFGCCQKIIMNLFVPCFPLLQITDDNNPPLATKNLNEYEDKDPIIDKCKIKARSGYTMLKYMDKAVDSFKEFSTPFLLIIPGIDKLVPPKIMIEFYEKSSSTDKTVLYYKNMWHAVTIEEEIWDVIDKSITWLKKRL